MSTKLSSIFDICPIQPLPEIQILKPNANSKLENFFHQQNIKDTLVKAQNLKPIEIKSVSTIISMVYHSKFENMTSIDWTQVYRFPDYIEFSQYDENVKKVMITNIWNYILTRPIFEFVYLFQRLTEFVFTTNQSRQKPLSIHWLFNKLIIVNILSQNSHHVEKNTQNLLLAYFNQNPAQFIMKSARKYQQMPWKIIETYGVFCSIEVAQAFLPYTVDALDNQQQITDQDIQWLYLCLLECDSNKELVKKLGIDLLNKLPSNYDALRIKGIIDWYKKHFDRKKERSLWNELDNNSKKRLLSWLGGLNFQDFQKLVKQIIDSLMLNPELESNKEFRENRDMEIRHLKRRSTFWSHYQDSILSMKIIVPEKSYHLAKNYNMTDIQKNPISTDPEICLLEFQKYIIAIIMRGKSTKTLIYDNNDTQYKLLFKTNFTKDDLLKNAIYTPKQTQHHLKYWQNLLQITLYHLGIYVDDGIKEFIFNPEDPKSRRTLKNGKLPDLTPEQHIELKTIVTNHNKKELKSK
jgi:hypothetical protein